MMMLIMMGVFEAVLLCVTNQRVMKQVAKQKNGRLAKWILKVILKSDSGCRILAYI
jgi:hypothetical protein